MKVYCSHNEWWRPYYTTQFDPEIHVGWFSTNPADKDKLTEAEGPYVSHALEFEAPDALYAEYVEAQARLEAVISELEKLYEAAKREYV